MINTRRAFLTKTRLARSECLTLSKDILKECIEFSFRRVIILLDLKILHAGSIVGKKIGDPVPYSASKPVVNQNKPQNNQNQYKAAPQNNNNLSSGSSYRNNTAVANESSTLNQSLTEHLTMPINSLSPYHNK